eukprot:Rmarinus@m.22148
MEAQYKILYTKDLTRKSKRWLDGTAKLHDMRLEILNEDGDSVFSSRLSRDQVIGIGEDVRLGMYIISFEELLEEKAKPEPSEPVPEPNLTQPSALMKLPPRRLLLGGRGKFLGSSLRRCTPIGQQSSFRKQTLIKNSLSTELSKERPATQYAQDTIKENVPPGTETGCNASETDQKAVVGLSKSESISPEDTPPIMGYYSVAYRDRLNRKRKGYEDGVLIVNHTTGKVMLKNMMGRDVTKSAVRSNRFQKMLKEGDELEVGSKDVEVLAHLEEQAFASGAAFLSHTSGKVVPSLQRFRKASTSLLQNKKQSDETTDPSKAQTTLPPNAVVLYSPQQTGEVPVVVDPFLGNKLRPHQIEGVKFMYHCVTSEEEAYGGQGSGCILADAPGLGKTLQTITLLWTLLKQSKTGKPKVKKALIVTPSSIVRNWSNEFRKWLGTQRLRPLVISGGSESASTVDDFVKIERYQVLILSYDMARSYAEKLREIQIGVLVCDEGHRLKKLGGTKLWKNLTSLRVSRRVILSGTPLQNDLKEFFALAEFVKPGILGDLCMFRQVFEQPIVKGQCSTATPAERAIADSRCTELQRLTRSIMLRRTDAVLRCMLLPKTDVVLCCRPSAVQGAIYREFLRSKAVASALSLTEQSAIALTCVTQLRKLCNSPALLRNPDAEATESNSTDAQIVAHEVLTKALEKIGPDEGIQKVQELEAVRFSGKFVVLGFILRATIETAQEKIVVVSNYAATLSLIETYCKHVWNLPTLRLDGSTAVQQRQTIVDRFNATYQKATVFLLSAKAGGVGLNLTAARRLVLVEPDWNPATDRQAYGRVWRDGQKKPVFIYRLLLTGSIDEKIYQRQIMKQDLERSVGTGGEMTAQTARSMSRDELRAVFEFSQSTDSLTFDALRDRAVAEESDEPNELWYRLPDAWRCSSSIVGIDDEILPKSSDLSSAVSMVFTRVASTDDAATGSEDDASTLESNTKDGLEEPVESATAAADLRNCRADRIAGSEENDDVGAVGPLPKLVESSDEDDFIVNDDHSSRESDGEVDYPEIRKGATCSDMDSSPFGMDDLLDASEPQKKKRRCIIED